MPTVIARRDKRVVKQALCCNCGAVIEYTPSEVRELYRGRDISGCSEGREGFNCPDCNDEVVTKSW